MSGGAHGPKGKGWSGERKGRQERCACKEVTDGASQQGDCWGMGEVVCGGLFWRLMFPLLGVVVWGFFLSGFWSLEEEKCIPAGVVFLAFLEVREGEEYSIVSQLNPPIFCFSEPAVWLVIGPE